MSQPSLGVSGRIAQKFLRTEITPLFALIGILLGLFALMVTPKEEEPQINVTFANVFIPFPGASAQEVEALISTPAEQVLAEIVGIEHIYSVSRPGLSILTASFEVGESRTEAIVRLYNAIHSNSDWLPPSIGALTPIIKPMGIDDVPMVALTLWSEDEAIGAYELSKVAHTIEVELKRVAGTRDIYTLGSPDQVVHIQLDIQKLAAYDIAIDELSYALQQANVSQEAGAMIRENQEILVRVGDFLSNADDIRHLVIGVDNGNPVYLQDVAKVSIGADNPEQYVWLGIGAASPDENRVVGEEFPAVTIAISKQPGSNAVDVANQVIQRIEQLKGTFIPDNIEVQVTRNYGATADEKANHLIQKLIFVTISVVVLVFFALGRREAFIVGTAIVVTLMMTLFASWAWGFTINRVSLFALIFSIGILVDDAIVVVENIHRHIQLNKGKLLHEIIPTAVDEVGGPTILATFAVIAALLPMAFVSGLMGPYMSPIPINASMGMLISLAVAFVITPWLTLKVFGDKPQPHTEGNHEPALYPLFNRIIRPFLGGNQGRKKRWGLFAVVMLMIGLSVSLIMVKLVVLKMLPFDNKSEFQVIVDMPEGTPVEETARVLRELGAYIATVPEVTDYQAYTATAAPVNFNGLVRQYYLRSDPHMGDLQVNLIDKSLRERQSHEIAQAVRIPLQAIASRLNANVKIVEVPPGPPVQSPLVAEVYGLDYAGQIHIAQQLREVFENTNEVVDVDDSTEIGALRYLIKVDKSKAALLGISQANIVNTLTMVLSGSDISFMHSSDTKYAVPIRVEISEGDKADLNTLMSIKVRSHTGELIPLADLVNVSEEQREYSIYHKDLMPVVFVTADASGETDSPLYGMFDIYGELQNKTFDQGYQLEQTLFSSPENPYQYSVKWDGEWQVTYETFRDMGIAYAVGIILIYLLVVAQFRSYLVPLVIMAPIPLTIIGVMPGHALFGAQFTATSMIGMIALAGIIVRNSILLVDFINQELAAGRAFDDAVIRSGAVRAKPIVLTGLAAMLGATFILDDPIFSGLAISLIFGILVSTVLTLLVIPVMYYALMRKRIERQST